MGQSECFNLKGLFILSRWLDDLFIFDTSTSNWNKVNITGYKPSARACHSLNRIKKKLYMFGGFNGVCSCNPLYYKDPFI